MGARENWEKSGAVQLEKRILCHTSTGEVINDDFNVKDAKENSQRNKEGLSSATFAKNSALLCV